MQQTFDVMVKAKPKDREMIRVSETIASICDSRLASALHDGGITATEVSGLIGRA